MSYLPLIDFDDCITMVLDACDHIRDPNALAWSIIDTKSENAITSALSVAINRMVGRRIAHVEYFYRTDLVIADRAIVDGGNLLGLFEAKAIYLTDYEDRRIVDARGLNDDYLAEDINKDLRKIVTNMRKKPREVSGVLGHAAMFYLYEVSDNHRMLKYGDRPDQPLEKAFATMDELVTEGRRTRVKTIDCGEADGTAVKIHVCVFEPN